MGGLIGPALGGILADAVGIRAPFTFTGAAAAIAAFYGMVRLPETRRSSEAGSAEAQHAKPSSILRNNAVPANLSRPVAQPRALAQPVLAAAAASHPPPLPVSNERLNDSTVCVLLETKAKSRCHPRFLDPYFTL